MRTKPVLEQAYNARTGDGHVHGKVHRSTYADDERAARFDIYRLTISLKDPVPQKPASTATAAPAPAPAQQPSFAKDNATLDAGQFTDEASAKA